jgi:mRNA interferase MazF
VKRGDVVVVPFPFQDRPGEKVRPALVVQSDAENQRLANVVLAMITGNLNDTGQPTTVLVDPKTANGAGSGLTASSLVKCYNLATIRKRRVLQVIGHLPDALMQQVNQALRAALELP